MIVADTSALYAALFPEDAHHEAALHGLSKAKSILVPAEILSETLALVQYRHGHVVGQKAAARLRRVPNMEIQPTPDDSWDDILAAAWKVHESHPKLSYPDAIVVAWANARKLDVLAFDDALLEAARWRAVR